MTETEARPVKLDPWILWFAAGAFFMCYLGTTTLGVVQPTIKQDLGLSHAEGVWVINAFMLTLAMFTAPAGRLGDTYGHRRTLIVGFVILAIGSLATAFSQTFIGLVFSLGIQGIGAAALYPSSVALVSNSVRPDAVGRAIGVWAGLGTFVFILGPLMAGVLTDVASWRWVFGINVVMIAVLILIGLLRVDESPKTPQRFDVTGTVTLLIGLAVLLFAVIQALVWGIASPATIALFAAGLVTLGSFVWIEWRKQDPLLDLRLLKNREFAGPTIVMFATQFVTSAYIIYIATFFQDVLGLSAILTGVGMLAAYVLIPPNARVAGVMTDSGGPRRPAVLGMSFLVAGPALAAVFTGADSYWLLIPSLVAMGIAQPYALTSLLTASAQALPPHVRGQGEGLVTALRWIAAALGTTVLGVAITSVRVDRTASEGALDAAIAGYRVGFIIATVVAAAGLVLTLVLIGTKAGGSPPEADPA